MVRREAAAPSAALCERRWSDLEHSSRTPDPPTSVRDAGYALGVRRSGFAAPPARFPERAATLRHALGESERPGNMPVGWYLASDVADLVGVSRRSIVEWTSIGTSSDEAIGASSRLLVSGRRRGHGCSRTLRSQGAARRDPGDRPELRGAIGSWPLQMAPLALYEGEKGARAALVGEQDGMAYDIGRGIGNQVFLPGLEELKRLARELRSGGWVVRIHPEIRHVEVNPDILSGKPLSLAAHQRRGGRGYRCRAGGPSRASSWVRSDHRRDRRRRRVGRGRVRATSRRLTCGQWAAYS